MKLPTWIYIGVAFSLLAGCGPTPTNNTPTPAAIGVVELLWDKDSADLDLYVISPSNEIAYADNQGITSGDFYKDDTDGLGPELFTVKNPETGNYTVKVNYHWHNGQSANVTAHVQIYHHGAMDSIIFTHVFTKADANSYSGPTPPNAWVATSTLTFQ